MKIILAALLFATAVPAQTRPAPTGTVIGHVVCADTQRPARLAAVKLVRLPSAADEKPANLMGDAAPAGDPVETSLDGAYTLRNVKPGQYYVVADKEGYLIPLAGFSGKDLASTDDTTRARVAAAVHLITVAADQTTREDITLARGGSLSGTVLYDDGSPASGIGIRLLVRNPASASGDGKDSGSKEPKWVESTLGRYRSFYSRDSTDDDGHFRITGLPAGEYATEALLTISDTQTQIGPMPGKPTSTLVMTVQNTTFSLQLYSGDVFRKAQAVPYTLGTAEVRTGSDLTFPLAKLHRVTGQVITRSGHAVNSGDVNLLNADDRSEMSRGTISFADQAFHLDYIPEGDFLLQIKGAKDVREVEVENTPGYTPRTHQETRTLTAYGDAEQPLEVKGDVSDVLVTVPPAKTAASAK